MRLAVAFVHVFDESRFVAAVVDKNRILDSFEDGEELSPNLPFVLNAVCPQAVLNSRFAVSNTHADQIVEIPVRKPLDIQIDGRAFELQFGTMWIFFSRIASAFREW